MNTLKRTQRELFGKTFGMNLLSSGLVLVAVMGLYAYETGSAPSIPIIAAAAILCTSMALLATLSTTRTLRSILHAVTQALVHASPSQRNTTEGAPIESLIVGRAFVTEIAQQIHELANIPVDVVRAEHHTEATQASTILSHLPLPIFVFNVNQQVTFASDSAISYADTDSARLLGKPLSEAFDMEFSSSFTLASWIADCQANKATDTAYWRRVRIRSKANSEYERQCDIAGSYNRNNSQGIEFVITMFDHTDEYDQDDQSVNFVALAVHELRTPLTIMRGYIEAFDDELTGKLDKQTQTYMDRLQASAKRLSSFVNNILNVTRIQENQLPVKLAQEDWPGVLQAAVTDMQLQASTRGKQIELEIDKDLPPVGVDRTTMYEVICNLIDNAIKYSAQSRVITVSSRFTSESLVETTVQDRGVGIPANVLPTLFEKFHRNHRNKLQISGTGLGLYICKAIVDAHGGNIWVNSQEGEGSAFTFTVLPYASLAAEQKTGDNADMTRTAHGWIKNHNLIRK
jgi:signal transduction histidine kinase